MSRRASLTARLTWLYAAVSALVLWGMGGLMVLAVERHFEDLDRDVLQDKLRWAQGQVAQAPDTAALAISLHEVLQHHAGVLVWLQPPADAAPPVYRSPGWPVAARWTWTALRPEALLTWREGGQTYRGLGASVVWHGQPLRVLVALDTSHHDHFMSSLHTVLALYAGLAVALSAAWGWWVARTGLAPLRAMKARAQTVTALRLDERMPAAAVPVEMADLAESLNDMLARLQRDFQRLSEFSSDLAHELRTPLSNLLTQTEVALAQPREALAYRDILASNAEELQRLSRTVSDMLLLAKAEHGLWLPQEEGVDLVQEVQALFEFYEALAEEQGVNLHREGQATLRGDRLMLRRALSNLLSNAVRHTPAGGTVRVVLQERGQTLSVAVENTGPGIDSHDLPRVFDRFYRADKARGPGPDGGAGLGLAITRAIVLAHGGRVSAQSEAGWTRFELQLPTTRE